MVVRLQVLNYPVALKNCMELVSVADTSLKRPPTFPGTVLSTGSIERFAAPDSANRVRSGRSCITRRYMLVIAKRLEAKPIFAATVSHQSYNSDVWRGNWLPTILQPVLTCQNGLVAAEGQSASA